jgi:uncharacterized protein YcbX
VPHIARIDIYPIKALGAVTVPDARVLPSGALEGDRRWALVDGRGRFVNGKHFTNIHALEATYDLAAGEVTIVGRTFALAAQGGEIAAWCSELLGEPVTWAENAEAGFPDDLVSPGPTLVTSASLAAVCGWFGLDLAGARLRFRANIEIDGVDVGPFWEDGIHGQSLQAGDVEIDAVNPCQRCVVPSRDAATGQAIAGFQKRFAELRKVHLPAGTSTAAFNHFYRFAVNTRIAAREAGKAIRLGDPVAISSR